MSQPEKTDLKKKIFEYGLRPYWQKLEALALPTISIIPGSTLCTQIQSKMGGMPALPRTFLWPQNNTGTPLTFLCQIQLKDLPFTPKNFPTNLGMMYFFFDLQSQGSFPPEQAHAFCFFLPYDQIPTENYVPPPENLEIQPQRAIAFISEISLPFDDLDIIEDEKHSSVYLERFANPPPPIHRMFGHPNQIQYNMPVELELYLAGLDLDDEQELPIEQMLGAMRKWTLLLQLDTCREFDLSWGDNGRLYFWIKNSDLEAKNFNNIYAIVQSY